MVKYTLILRKPGEPDSYGEYNELILNNVIGEEIPRKDDIIDSIKLTKKLERYATKSAPTFCTYDSFEDSRYIVKNIEHFLTDNNDLEAKTRVTAVRIGKSDR